MSRYQSEQIMVEQLIIGGLFLGAVGYMAGRVYKTVLAKNAGCAKGCGCATDKK